MKLHNNQKEFTTVISAVAEQFHIHPAIVEKDYYVTIFLKELTTHIPSLLFKGGTSLSKCFKIVNRFSEDIDLTLTESHTTTSYRRKLKDAIIASCRELGLTLLNEDQTRSRRDFNRYKIDYAPRCAGVALKQILLVETTFIVQAYPYETLTASSLIYDYLASINQDALIKEYELEPFPIHVQSLNRTLADKIFAVCDYYLSDRTSGHSRHIYDIYKLLSEVKIDCDFMNLFQRVRADRKENDFCLSAKDDCDIVKPLQTIIDKEIYKSDYNTITSQIIYDNVSYEEAIEGLKTLKNLLQQAE